MRCVSILKMGGSFMNVRELSREQLVEIKQRYLCERGRVSYGELSAADDMVSDAVIFDEYADTEFVEDDFMITH